MRFRSDRATAPPRSAAVCVGLLLAVQDRDGHPVAAGLLEDGHSLAIPVECGPSRTQRYLVYAGNPDAWPGDPPGLTYRLPLAVRNLEDQAFTGVVLADRQHAFGRLTAGEALAVQTPAAGETGPWRPCLSLAGALAFRVSLPPRSELSCLAYAVPAGQAPPAATAAAGYRDLLDARSGNLLRNPGMEAGTGAPEGWSTGVETSPGAGLATSGADTPDVSYAWASPGYESDRCLRMTVGQAAPKAWRGWRQTVAARPDTTYLYAAWVRTADITDGADRPQ